MRRKAYGRRIPAVSREQVRRAVVLASVGVLVQLSVQAIDETRPAVVEKASHAQAVVDDLRGRLAIEPAVHVAVVVYHPFVFSVEPFGSERDRFVLSIELGFLDALEEDELHAALAHELGHVWIFTHHPFLQTERLANEIALRAVDRRSFEKVYRKLWSYEGTTGVPLENLLGVDVSPGSRSGGGLL